MKSSAVIVLVLAAFLAQGAVSEPLFEFVVDVTGNILNTAFQGLNMLASAIIKPIAGAVEIVGNVTSSFNSLLQTGIASTANILGSTVNATVTTTTKVMNGLITVSNDIVKMNVEYLTKGAKVIMNTLASGLNLITNAIKMAAIAVSQVIATIRSTIGNMLNTLTQNIDACVSKLNYLGLSTSSSRLTAYKLNLTTILSNLQTNITSEINAYSIYVNTTTSTLALEAATISEKLTKELKTVVQDREASDSAAFQQCITDSADYIAYVQLIVMENAESCVNTSTGGLNSITGGYTADLQEKSQASLDTVCQCVESIIIFSLPAQRLTAKACADMASAKLTTNPIETQANGILNLVVTQVDNILYDFDECVKAIRKDIPEVVDFVSGSIQGCVGL